MPLEMVREYEIEYSSVRLPDSEHWAAMLAIYGPSHNPMHRNCIFPERRVAVEAVFASATEAEAEARKIALEFIQEGKHHN